MRASSARWRCVRAPLGARVPTSVRSNGPCVPGSTRSPGDRAVTTGGWYRVAGVMAPRVKTQDLAPTASSPMPRANALIGDTPSNMAIHLGGGASPSGSCRNCLAAAAKTTSASTRSATEAIWLTSSSPWPTPSPGRRMSPKTRPWRSRRTVMPATHARAAGRPSGARSSRMVMMIWMGTMALPVASGMSITRRSGLVSLRQPWIRPAAVTVGCSWLA
jgi:hypothetical protein